MAPLHVPVMLDEVIDFLEIKRGGAYLDGTFGEGGHSLPIARKAGRVCAIDRDPKAVGKAAALAGDLAVQVKMGLFSQFAELYPGQTWDGVLLDLGVSTRQLLEPERGFSFSKPGPLDMRMGEGTTLQEKLLSTDPEVLAEYLRGIGVKSAGRRAHEVIDLVRSHPGATTEELAGVAGPKRGPKHPATTLFLALRMWLNEESEEVDRTIPKVIEALNPGGRLVVLTFHSEEDRRVKRWFKQLAGECICEQTPCLCPRVKKIKKITRKPLVPTDDEMSRNPRSRSAKLRCVEKAGSGD